MNKDQLQEKEAWDNYVIDHGGHPLQLWGWGEVKASHGWKVKRMFLYSRDDEVIGAAQILIRRLPWPLKSLAYVPRGPIIEEGKDEELLKVLATYIKQAYHSVTLMIEPDSIDFTLPEGWRKSRNHILPAQTVVLDLKKSEADLQADMTKKTRQYIRKSGNENMHIKMVKSREELDKCLAIYHDTAKRAKFSLHSDQYYYDVFDQLDEYSPVFAAYVDNQPVAFLWLAITADNAYELYGGVNEVGQQLRVNYALKWYAIRKSKEWGLSRYDFGGLLEGGVSTFKMGWAAGETRLAGAFDRPLSSYYVVWNLLLPAAKATTRRIKRIIGR